VAQGLAIHVLIGSAAWSRAAAEKLVSSLVPKDDLLNPVSLTEDQLRADPDRLFAELSAIPMFGGRAVVWVRGAGSFLCRLVEDILESKLPAGAGVLIAEMEALPAQSELSNRGRDPRLMITREPAIAPEALASQLAADRRIGLEPDAIDLLIELTGGDRGVMASELDKLSSLSMTQAGPIGAATVMALCGDAGFVSIESIVDGALSGDAARLEAALVRGRESGTTGHQIASGVIARLFRDLRSRNVAGQGGMAGYDLAQLARDIFEMQRDTRLKPGFDLEIVERLLLRFATARSHRS
jgi:DNA polymerase-3 subunit delta